MQNITDRLATLHIIRDDLVRHMSRRDHHVEMIDWHLMTDEDCFEARIDEESLAHEIAETEMEIDHLECTRDLDLYDDD